MQESNRTVFEINFDYVFFPGLIDMVNVIQTTFTRRFATAPEPSKSPNWGIYLSGAGALGLGAYAYLSYGSNASAAAKPVQEKSPLDPNSFINFKLKKVVPYNDNTSTFIFELPDNQASLLTVASCVVVKSADPEALVGDNGKPVIRPYTPISQPDTPGELSFLVKKYPTGKASVHIHNLKPGEELAIKGPIVKFEYKGKHILIYYEYNKSLMVYI